MTTYGRFVCCPTQKLGAPTGLDLRFAVASPIVALAYCYSNFYFDRETLRINNEEFPDGIFERQSRFTTDPPQTVLVRTCSDSLRILSSTDFLLRIARNLSFCNALGFRKRTHFHLLLLLLVMRHATGAIVTRLS